MIPKNEVTAKEAVVIPGQAIRLRILANSDLESDQALKRQVRDAVNAKITVWVKNLTSIQEARKVIQAKLPEIQATAEKVVKQQGSNQAVKVKFGQISFPTKLYGDFLYPAGKYQAILITLGEGKGANWWCVLFPPLCFLDFSNGVAVSNGFEGDRQQPKKTAASVEPMDQSPDNNVDEGKTTKAQVSNSKGSADDNKDLSGGDQESTQDQVSGQEKEINQARDADQEQNLKNTPAADRKQDSNANQNQNLQQNRKPATVGDYTNKDGDSQTKTEAPVYTAKDEQPVKVKLFVVELWDKLFN